MARPRKPPSARTQEIIALLEAGELSLREIGRRYGVTQQAIQSIGKHWNVRRPAYLSKNGRLTLQAVMRHARSFRGKAPHTDNAVALVQSGFTFGQAARELGISRSAVAGAVFRARQKTQGRTP